MRMGGNKNEIEKWSDKVNVIISDNNMNWILTDSKVNNKSNQMLQNSDYNEMLAECMKY